MAVAAVLLPVLAGSPALADGRDDGKAGKDRPPTRMSAVGGKRLGMSGTQVDPGTGAPELPDKLTGKSWLIADAESGDVLAAHNAHWRLPPASTLKMLFADTVLPELPKDKEHEVEPSDLEGMGEGSSLVGIKEHQKYTVHDMWLGVFLRSGNDAVHVLSAMNGGVEKTVQDMQRHARDLHADDTHVVSPDGYDEEGQVSSAYDLTLFARSGLQKADFREYCSTVRAQFPGEAKKAKKGEKGEKKRPTFEIQNTNRLLTGDFGLNPYKGMAGVKNGYTSKAGATFTGVAQRGDRVLLVTVMSPESEEHNAVYKESASLLDWGFDAAGKVEPVGRLVAPRTVADARADGGKGEGKNRNGASKTASVAAGPESEKGTNGALVALGVTGGALAVLAAAAFLVHRHWPLPDLMRRR